MSMKKRYTCDICGEKIKDPSQSFGIVFKNYTEFTLGGYGATRGKHLCYICAVRLKECLNSDEITKLITKA